MKAIKTEEFYTLHADGVRVDAHIYLIETDDQLVSTHRFKSMDNSKNQIPERLAGERTYRDGSRGFIREDGSMFFLVGGSGVESVSLDELLDLGLNHYAEAWTNHSLPIGEAA